MMKDRTFAIWIMLLAVLAVPAFAVEKPAEKEDPAFTHDFGSIPEGGIYRHTFTLKNDTNKTFTITNVSTSCGCTASEVKKKKLAPGESTAIRVSFKSKKYSGAVKQFVNITTDDLDRPFIRFIIKANVVKRDAEK